MYNLGLGVDGHCSSFDDAQPLPQTCVAINRGNDVAAMAWELHAIEQTQSQGRRWKKAEGTKKDTDKKPSASNSKGSG